jgi:glycosyltransferase involved in cell wall biosynthesis
MDQRMPVRAPLMRDGQRIGVVIPARDEEAAIGRVIADIPDWVDCIVVADNGSRDATGPVAEAAGAIVAREPKPGYGGACLTGLAALPEVEIVVFVDGDYSDFPEDMTTLVNPILAGEADLVIGSRMLRSADKQWLTPQQRYGNTLAVTLIRLIWGARFTDLGPFRAISSSALARLAMTDRDYGWTVEMQIKAAKQRLVCLEVPARYRQRIGVSKISGTVKGTLLAGTKILTVIARHALR